LATEPPRIQDIGLRSGADLYREFIREVESTPGLDANQRATFTTLPSDYKPLSESPYTTRALPPSQRFVEPYYVCYGRLYFEEKNSERFGWDLGPMQPLISTLYFYKDMLFLPYHFGTRPCQRYECSAGYCLPGDPVPYLLYPPEVSLTGGVLQAGTTVGLYAIFP
jgi:hypothetical protein